MGDEIIDPWARGSNTPLINIPPVLTPGGDQPLQPSDATMIAPDASILPTVGAVTGGITSGLLYNAPKFMRNLPGPAGKVVGFVGTLIPSALGTAGGTVVGTALEQQLEGRGTLSAEGAQEILNNTATEVAYDSAGNIVMSLFGKTFTLAKDLVGNLQPVFPDARQAAQAFLQQYGGTLTGGQLLGGFREMIESFIHGPFTKKFFADQQTSVDEALMLATIELRQMAPGTPEFRATLGQINAELFEKFRNNPELISSELRQGLETVASQEVANSAFSAAMKETQRALSASVDPFYKKLADIGKGVKIDITDLTDLGKAARELSAKSEGFISLSTQMKALSRLGQQGSQIDLFTLHKMRSELSSLIMDAKNPMSQAGVKNLQELEQMMTVLDKTIDKHAAKIVGGNEALIKEYRDVTSFYKDVKSNMFGDIVTQSLVHSPKGLGEILFSNNSLKALSELKKSAKTAEKMSIESIAVQEGLQRGTPAFNKRVTEIAQNPTEFGALSSVQILNNVRQGYIEKFLSTPESILKWANQLKTNKQARGVLAGMFDDPAQIKFLENLANAARTGKNEVETSIGVRQMVIGGAAQSVVALGVAGYQLLDAEQQDKIAGLVGPAVLTATGLLLSQRQLARALTDPDAVNALAKLTDYRSKISGGAIAKLLEPLVRGGYFDDINNEEARQNALPNALQYSAPSLADPFAR